MFGWFASWFNDFKDWMKGVWTDTLEWLTDFTEWIFEALLAAVLVVVTAIPAPDFLTGVNVATFLGNIGPDILYFLSRSGLTDAFAILGSAYGFRLLRKLVTLGQW